MTVGGALLQRYSVNGAQHDRHSASAPQMRRSLPLPVRSK
jgi:hypothetical protein